MPLPRSAYYLFCLICFIILSISFTYIAYCFSEPLSWRYYAHTTLMTNSIYFLRMFSSIITVWLSKLEILKFIQHCSLTHRLYPNLIHCLRNVGYGCSLPAPWLRIQSKSSHCISSYLTRNSVRSVPRSSSLAFLCFLDTASFV